MNLVWRDPKIELPPDRAKVWVMLRSHKERGGFFESAMGIQIVCGEAYYHKDGCWVENFDELGYGSIKWHLDDGKMDLCAHDEECGVAWIYIEEMPVPKGYPG